jgi:hypothetical protein
MRAFTAHCSLFFWKGALVVPDGKEEGMGQFGKLTLGEGTAVQGDSSPAT